MLMFFMCLSLQNADKGYGHINESLHDVDANYDSVPIEAFGLALLRGCGWQEGEGIGKTNKRYVYDF